MNRRDWVKAMLLACAATATGQVKLPDMLFPTDPRHRLAVATYPFRAVIDAPGNSDRVAGRPGMTLPAFAQYVRSRFNVFGIEPLDSHFTSTTPAAIASLRRSLDAAGIRTVNIPVDAPADLCSTDPGTRAKSVALYRKWIDIAAELGSPSVRIGRVPRCSSPESFGEAAQALQPVAAYGAARGVVILLENDDPVLATAARITGILRAANTPWLRGLPDFANGLLGGDERFNHQAVREMLTQASTVAHVKDGENIRGKDVHVSLRELFLEAKQAGFNGYYSMESDDNSDPEQSTARLIEQSLALM